MASVDPSFEQLRRGTDAIVPEDEFHKKLAKSRETNTPLRIKYGIDPTGIDVHLGHTVALRKLRQFQELGHTAVLIIGNYTALVGDPSGRDETRAALTEEQVERNALDYLEQVGKIIDLNRAEVHRNGDWFAKWSFLDVLALCRNLTIGQVSERDDFAKRLASAQPVYLHECLYPLMQGHDSVEVRADVELGGTEQLYNLMLARDLQKAAGQAPQIAMTMPILVGTDGHRKMGKSLNNYIGVNEDANNQFGKVMSLPDTPMRQYFTLLTDLPSTEIDKWLSQQINPRDAKEQLGKLIVEQYHGQEAAELAATAFRDRAKNQAAVEVVPVQLDRGRLDDHGQLALPRLLVALGLRSTTSEARRVIEQGGVRLGDSEQSSTDLRTPLTIEDGLIVRVGKGNKQKAAQVCLTTEASSPDLSIEPSTNRDSNL